ncbi:FGGY family carbohydrate kinase [Weissella confusa]|uniref:FGGY family carbohydrate kinase n=1 Tax=Weissella confusa TaxID=1583 RepID=UPI00107F5736|nr:FGGY family carbohydrate kinase [Weissella confusa]MBF7058026.1 gluconate kinase [Weissella confusa]MBJ7640047.1 gluconate kinase [Weissella confusa]MBJ7656041.1 gluconate kinase [Weissella confusa]MBU5285710.1 gluconate kinase [Weissella confusa]MDY2529217.1 FGGY family carbohydrate kinase [Weissella confusa]
MKYTVTIDMAAIDVVATLIDENKNQKVMHFPYEGMAFPTDPVTPDNIVNTLVDALASMRADLPGEYDEIVEVRFATGIANGWFALDENFTPLTDVVSGGDNRAAKYVDALMINGIGGQLQRKTGLPMTATEPLVLTLWMKNERPEAYTNAAHFMGVLEYVTYRLFGLNIVDEALAARTGYYNVAHKTWDVQALAVTGLTAEQLPEIVADTEIKAPLLPEVMVKTGLSADTIFYLR